MNTNHKSMTYLILTSLIYYHKCSSKYLDFNFKHDVTSCILNFKHPQIIQFISIFFYKSYRLYICILNSISYNMDNFYVNLTIIWGNLDENNDHSLLLYYILTLNKLSSYPYHSYIQLNLDRFLIIKLINLYLFYLHWITCYLY